MVVGPDLMLMHMQRIEAPDQGDGLAIRRRQGSQGLGDPQLEAGIRLDLLDSHVGIEGPKPHMPVGVEVEQPEVGDQPFGALAAMAQLRRLRPSTAR